MSNEELSPSDELASAYLDGELEATERAAAEADPTVMKAVDAHARVRAALGEIGAVSPSTKTAAVAAALAEFDAMRAAPTAAPERAATVISMHGRRQRTLRMLSRAAAVLVVGVLVVAALKVGGTDNKDSSTAGTATPPAAATQLPQLKAAAETESAAATAAPAGTAAPGAVDSGAGAVRTIDSKEALREYAASFTVAATGPGPQAAAPSTAAAAAGTAAASGGGFATPSCLSADQAVLGPIVFQGTPAFAVRNTTTGVVQAVADTDCRVLAAATAP